MLSLIDINGIGPALAKRLAAQGVVTVQDLASASATTLANVQGLSVSTAAVVIAEARKVAMNSDPVSSPDEDSPLVAAGVLDESSSEIVQLEVRIEKMEAKIAKLEKRLEKYGKPSKKNKKSKKRKKKG